MSTHKKHIITLLLLIVIAIPSAYCQKTNINHYNNILVMEQPNWDYNDLIVEEVSNYFKSIGFKLISDKEFERIQKEDPIKSLQTLVLTYNYFIRYGSPSSLSIELVSMSNDSFRFEANGNSFTARGDMKSAMNNIFRQIDKLNYHFDPIPFTKNALPKLEACSWSEDSIRLYLDTHSLSPIEGIYKNYSTDVGLLSLYIVKDKQKYYGIVLTTKNWIFEKGDVLLEFEFISEGIYDMVWLDSEDSNNNISGIATYSERILTMNTVNNKAEELKLIKTYPNKGERQNSSTVSEEGLALSATGSGIMISDGIIATNYHVIENAKKVEVVLNVNGIQMAFDSRVLCVDKTNDLALLSIKDKQYHGSNTPPFKILPNATDVGTSVFTMGFPLSSILGEEMKVTDGIISSKSGYNGNIVTYQITAPIQPGNSGGALFDKKGNLVGITNAGVPGAENVSYAIKSSYLLNLIDSAPINIDIQIGQDTTEQELSKLVKKLSPFIVYIKVY